MASIYLPPIARKKKVDGWPRQDSNRVFSDFEDNFEREPTSYGSNFVRHNIPPTPQRALSPTRKNKPQSTAVTFLRQNPRFVCEPICHVDTLVPNDEAISSWWPNEIKEQPVIKPQYTFHSTSRADYRNFSLDSPRCASYSRHEVLTQKAPKPEGNIRILPGCSSAQAIPNVLEKISYEHQFNSRLDPSHPIRGRRHGCFVWRKASVPVYRSEHNKYLKSKSSKNKKNSFNELRNTETEDNSDAKSVISMISDKPQTHELAASENNKKSETFERKVKSDAWISNEHTSNQQSKVARQPSQTMPDDMFDFTEDEIESGIRPSRPRRQSPPPHLV